ncbi:MAG: hypothetical protein HYS13_07565 [Planctomycetia bacterium]|nr:hypothetical protein [Planctomycetia bacterium]
MAGKGRQNADEQLLLSLACGASAENAARKAGVCERTVYRRLDDPEFQRRLRKLKTEILQRGVAMITAAQLDAVRTLVELQGHAQAESVRLGAARAILEMGAKLRETVELEERMAALEERLANQLRAVA